MNLTSDYLKETLSVVHYFTLYFNRTLQQIKDEIQKKPIYCRDINHR